MKKDNSGILVLFFFLFIIGAVFAVIVFDGKDKKEEDISNIDEIITSNTPKDSKEVIIVTSNKKSNKTSSKTSNKTSSKTSNKTSSKTSNKQGNNEIPISYFITKIDKNKIYVGGTAKITVDIKPSNATNKSVKYYTSDSTIARVSSNGTITGITPGVCTITVDVYDGGTAEVDIQVLKVPRSNSNSNPTSNPKSNPIIPPIFPSNSNSNPTSNTPSIIHVSSVSLNMTSITLQKGNSTNLTATVYPSNANDKRVTWSSSNTSVATVSNGKVTATGAGNATITVTSVDGNKKASASITVTTPPPVKNGWYTEGGKRYYYVSNVKQTNKFVDYIYLGNDGAAQPKIGNFDITLYGTTAWTTKYDLQHQYLNLKSDANSNSTNKTRLDPGTKVTIIGAEKNGYLPVRVINTGATGWIWANSTFVNLPELMPNIVYEIPNASSSAFTSAGYSISNVTGQKLYKFSKKYNDKIKRNEYYAPLLYPTAKKLQNALNYAKSLDSSFNFVIYDSYRPKPVSKIVSDNLETLMKNNKNVYNAINKTVKGYTYSKGWFINNGGGNDPTKGSNHSAGMAIDIGLLKAGKKMPTQSAYGALDTSAVTEYNSDGCSGKQCDGSVYLKNIMTHAGFGTLRSEWWHFNDNDFSSKLREEFYIYD